MRLEAVEVRAAREDRAQAAVAGKRRARERRRHRRGQVDQPREQPAERPDLRVGEVGAMEGHDVGSAADRERAPAAEAVVRVHDVEALTGVAAPQLARSARVRACAGREREQLEVDAFGSAERFDLVAHEAADRRALGRRPQVGDDEHPHPRRRLVR